MADLIDREVLIGVFAGLVPWAIDSPEDDAYARGLDDGYHALMAAPAVDAVPVRRGRWITHITEDGYKSGYDCSVCGVWLIMPNGLRKYCCDCGALMDGGEKND